MNNMFKGVKNVNNMNRLIDLCPPRAPVLDVDRRLHPGVTGCLQENVGLQEGVRRGGPARCASEDLLNHCRIQCTKDPISMFNTH